jgi:hypothetical protein
MKTNFCLLIAMLVIAGCSQPDKALQQRITGADSVAINFFRGDGTMDTVVEVRIIRDKLQLDRLAQLIAAKPVHSNDQCGYDGSLHYFKMNQVVQDVNFRMAKGCMYFSFVESGVRMVTALSGDAKDLINSWRKDAVVK